MIDNKKIVAKLKQETCLQKQIRGKFSSMQYLLEEGKLKTTIMFYFNFIVK
jgi:hypothetical protein